MTEIVFFPGWSGLPKQSYNPLLKRFARLGVKTHTIPYKMGGTGSIKGTAKLADNWLWWKTDHQDCSNNAVFVGHSMGGLVARYLIQKMNWEPKAYISLGTPHQGVNYYNMIPHWGPLASAAEMRADSIFLERLNPLEWPVAVPGMTLEAGWDFVVPSPSGRYEKISRNEKIPRTTHASMLWSQRTFYEIAAFLSYELNLFNL